MSLALYRKYRPKTFAEIIGQEHIVKTLTNALSSEMISHAYLFTGPRGCGKTTIARLLAKAANCETRKPNEFEPCNKCSSCIEINESRSIDLIEIDAASHRGIDDIREIRQGIKFAPTKSKYKIFIIDECHQLSKDAANALLKTLEEPPAHAIFILATTEIQKMIATILSRCQRFDFWNLTMPQIIQRLEFLSEKEKIKIEKPALELIALQARGSIRDAESLLDQVISFSSALDQKAEIKTQEIKDLLGIVDLSSVSQFVDFLVEKNISKTINYLQEILEKGKDPQEFTKTLISYLRQGLLLKISPDMQNHLSIGLTKEELQKLQNQANGFSEQELQKLLQLFLKAENQIKYSSIPQLPIELAIVEAIGLEKE
ncbi:DNA polymerase III subunit gamma/tau [Candidatus Parcubacteria bacterium]|nr:DNA polymerase III subunit gamma/tau [Candidatus Parcubacteria bacterium]